MMVMIVVILMVISCCIISNHYTIGEEAGRAEGSTALEIQANHPLLTSPSAAL